MSIEKTSHRESLVHKLAGVNEPQEGLTTVGLWWLGQSGFALRHGGQLILIDPYLSDTLAKKYEGTLFPHQRLVEAPITPTDVRGCDAYLCTHGHTDHMDPETIRGVVEHNDPDFIVPRTEKEKALQCGVPEDWLIGLGSGEPISLGDITIEAIPAAHEELEVDAEGNHRFLGYLITLGGVRIYHSGDCMPYDGQVELLADRSVDLALLPINGRDAYRRANGVPGNFTVAEAVSLCHEARILNLVGHHFGMFDFNTVDPGEAEREFVSSAGELRWLLPELGRCYQISDDGNVYLWEEN